MAYFEYIVQLKLAEMIGIESQNFQKRSDSTHIGHFRLFDPILTLYLVLW